MVDYYSILSNLETVKHYVTRFIKDAPLTLWIPPESEVIFGEAKTYPFNISDEKYEACFYQYIEMIKEVIVVEIRSTTQFGLYNIGKKIFKLRYYPNPPFMFWYFNDNISSSMLPYYLTAAAIVMRRNNIPINNQSLITMYNMENNTTIASPLQDHITGNLRKEIKLKQKSSICSMM